MNELRKLLCWLSCLRLTESSAGVAEKLAYTQRMAEDLIQIQNAAIKSQETILRNGEELKTTLLSSTQGKMVQVAEVRYFNYKGE